MAVKCWLLSPHVRLKLMPKTTKSSRTVGEIVRDLTTKYPDITFSEDSGFRWSPETRTIFYNPKSIRALWSLLHEVGHMLNNHSNYSSDIGLLRLEVAAWSKAQEIGKDYGIIIEEEHIQKCLDSYRDWIYKRSACPVCTQAGLERSHGMYSCINCSAKWKVSPERFCRPYRKTVAD